MNEAHHQMCFNNKAIFRAGVDMVKLSQSACQAHAYDVWLYGVPIIVSTNGWLMGATEEERAWLSANSVVVVVQQPLWAEPSLMLTHQ